MTKEASFADVLEILAIFNKKVKKIKKYKCYNRKDVQIVIKNCRPLSPKTKQDILESLDIITSAIIYLDVLIENREAQLGKISLQDNLTALPYMHRMLFILLKEIDIANIPYLPTIGEARYTYSNWNKLDIKYQYSDEMKDKFTSLIILLKEVILNYDERIKNDK